MTSPARTVVAVGLLAALAGCSSKPAGSGDSTAAPTDPAVSAVTSVWVPVRDAQTGIRFGMPDRPQLSRTTQPSNGGPAVERRQYKAFLDYVELSVTIDSGVGKPVRFGDPATLARELAAGSRTQGNRNVTIVDQQPTTVQGRPALDFRLSYTPKEWVDGQTVFLLVRAVQAPAAMVIMQTYVPRTADASLTTWRTLQAKLVAGLTLP